MNKGFIYKISHFDVSTERNNYPDRCYVGQTDVSLIKRFDGHKADARNFLTKQ